MPRGMRCRAGYDAARDTMVGCDGSIPIEPSSARALNGPLNKTKVLVPLQARLCQTHTRARARTRLCLLLALPTRPCVASAWLPWPATVGRRTARHSTCDLRHAIQCRADSAERAWHHAACAGRHAARCAAAPRWISSGAHRVHADTLRTLRVLALGASDVICDGHAPMR